MAQSNTATKQKTLTREFDAPRDLVFAAWTEPEHFAQWWGPHGFTIPAVEMDVRPGGAFTFTMQRPNGETMVSTGEFREVVAPERLVMVEWATPEGDSTPQFEILYTVQFEEAAGKTRITLTFEFLRADPSVENLLEGASMGLSQALDKLAAHLSSISA